MRHLLISIFLVTALFAAKTQSAVYLERAEFLAGAFTDVPPASTLWLKGALKASVKDILGHDYRSLRVRYWQQGDRSAWILDEVGKEQPITIGVVVDGDEIRQVAILAFRESRGWEVRHPYFTEQFRGLVLTDHNDLSMGIDGISGATLSVRAVTRISRMALFLHHTIRSTTTTAITGKVAGS